MADEFPEHSEVLVIGGGPGGYAAAFRASDLGLDVTLVTDEERLGGVCLHRGCIPGKALVELADLFFLAQEAQEHGLHFADPKVDLDRVRDWKRDVVGHLVDGLHGLVDARGIRIVQARAAFDGPERVIVTVDGERRRLGFDHAIVATGSSPTPLPEVAFGDRIIDSAAALELRDIPARLLVVGGGYIGLELGTVYAALGSSVTLIEVTDRLLPMAEPELVGPLADRMAERFEAVHLETTATEMIEEDDRVRVSLDGPDGAEDATFDRALIAIGRRPNTDELGLETTGVELDDEGRIRVDGSQRTAEPNVLAVGDVTGGLQLAHEAFEEGIVAAEVAAGRSAAFDARAVPSVVYTDPQLAWCGLSEPDAAERDIEVEVVRFPWQASGRAVMLGAGEGLTKLVCEPGSGRILGVGIVGRRAESLITEGVLAIEMGAVLEDLARSIAPHPTLSETLHESAKVGIGSPLHLAPSGGANGAA